MRALIRITIIALLAIICHNTEAQILDKLQQFVSKEVEAKDISIKRTEDIPIFYYRGELFSGTIILPWNKIFIKNGKLSGYNKIYNDDGSPYLETTFVDGISEGAFVEYRKVLGSDQITKGRNVHGKHDGLITVYDSDGKITDKTYYKNGVLDGTNIHYDSDGKITLQENYRNGNRDGYYEDWMFGKIFRKGNYSNDKKVGIWIELRYDSNVRYHDEENYYEVEYVNGTEISSRKLGSSPTANKQSSNSSQNYDNITSKRGNEINNIYNTEVKSAAERNNYNTSNSSLSISKSEIEEWKQNIRNFVNKLNQVDNSEKAGLLQTIEGEPTVIFADDLCHYNKIRNISCVEVGVFSYPFFNLRLNIIDNDNLNFNKYNGSTGKSGQTEHLIPE